MAEYIDIDAQVVVTDTRGRERETTVRHIFEMNKGVYTAADVVERKHGKWKTAYLDHEAFGIRPQVWYCSECQQITSFRTFFCPNCGADMRGTNDEKA